jgi:penicillin amidase
LKESFRDRLVPADARGLIEPRGIGTGTVIGWLSDPDRRFGPDPIAGRNAALIRSLDEAVRDLSRRLGPEMDGWRYGQARLKHVEIRHPLSEAVGAGLRAKLDVGPLPRGGSARTVNNTSDNDNQTDGATFRIVADPGDWDRSVGTNAPGQSGDPDSPHYRDLFGPWAEGTYFPVAFSRAKVESVAESRTTLVPEAGRARGDGDGAPPRGRDRVAPSPGREAPVQYESELSTSPKPRVDSACQTPSRVPGAIDQVPVLPL